MCCCSASVIATDATAPVFAEVPVGTPAVDPVVQALTLTDVVVGATVSALLLALAVQVHKRSHTLDPAPPHRAPGAERPSNRSHRSPSSSRSSGPRSWSPCTWWPVGASPTPSPPASPPRVTVMCLVLLAGSLDEPDRRTGSATGRHATTS